MINDNLDITTDIIKQFIQDCDDGYVDLYYSKSSNPVCSTDKIYDMRLLADRYVNLYEDDFVYVSMNDLNYMHKLSIESKKLRNQNVKG